MLLAGCSTATASRKTSLLSHFTNWHNLVWSTIVTVKSVRCEWMDEIERWWWVWRARVGPRVTPRTSHFQNGAPGPERPHDQVEARVFSTTQRVHATHDKGLVVASPAREPTLSVSFAPPFPTKLFVAFHFFTLISPVLKRIDYEESLYSKYLIFNQYSLW